MANRNVARIPRTCQQCSQGFDVAPSALKGGALYCSHACRNTANRVEKVTKTCGQCSAEFTVYPSALRYPSMFCSRRCFGLSNVLTLDEKFWSKVNKTDTCWLWTGAIRNHGYGLLQHPKGTMRQAHRFSWEIHYGPIPKNRQVCHKCDVRNCVRPDHLFVGTATDNMQDMARKGRQNSKLNPDKVRDIRQRYAEGVSARDLAAIHNVDRSLVHLIVKRKFWIHVT
jgi:hypothetical protein